MTLRVAKMLALKLRALGARVSFVRDKAGTGHAVSARRFSRTRPAAVLQASGNENPPREDFDGPDDPLKEQTVRWQSEILFYRGQRDPAAGPTR